MAFDEPLVVLLHEFCGSSVTLKGREKSCDRIQIFIYSLSKFYPIKVV